MGVKLNSIPQCPRPYKSYKSQEELAFVLKEFKTEVVKYAIKMIWERRLSIHQVIIFLLVNNSLVIIHTYSVQPFFSQGFSSKLLNTENDLRDFSILPRVVHKLVLFHMHKREVNSLPPVILSEPILKRLVCAMQSIRSM